MVAATKPYSQIATLAQAFAIYIEEGLDDLDQLARVLNDYMSEEDIAEVCELLKPHMTPEPPPRKRKRKSK